MKRSIVRKLTLDDTQDFLECLNNPDLQDTFGALYTTSEDEARIILNLFLDENRRKERLIFGIKESEDPEKEKRDKIVGIILSKKKQEKVDLTCLINPKYQGKGYASRGLKETMKLLHRKDKSIRTFQMLISDENKDSQKLAIRLGFDCKGKSIEIPTLNEYTRSTKREKKEEGR